MERKLMFKGYKLSSLEGSESKTKSGTLKQLQSSS